MYEPLENNVDLPALERDVLARWKAENTFATSLEQTKDNPRWVVFEGPPTANGMPGIHHVEARSFKDVFPRFKTMKGYHVPRRAGWDCHGLPVELQVEKELGFTNKKQIEEFGIAEFNEKCRESVLKYVAAWQNMTERMGYWVDFDDAYRTMDAHYIDSLWWGLKQIYDKGLLVEDYRVAPYCPRDQTALSSHELGQPGAYSDIVSPSAYVRFPITSGPWAGTTDLLIWTTTPWTLVSNTAVAVHPDVTYALVRHPDRDTALVVAEPLVGSALGDGWQVIETVPGKALERITYQRPFEFLDIPDAHYVVLADFVTTDDGTGLVHMAPAFGADDMAACRTYGMPIVNPIRRDGTFEPDVALVGGVRFADADQPLLDNLTSRGLLHRSEAYTHSYPHCWRCHSALLYYAMPSWYIRTSQIKDQLLAENEDTNWFPPGIKHGRYGDWLSNNVDWALSRNRYWGTPLPIWRCADNHITCVGSRAELSQLTGQNLAELDPHRPFVDEVTFACPSCGHTAHRVTEVIDVWFDSGAMPFAQWGAPWRNDAEAKENYPAQYICEAIDQTRGWFYTLMAVGTLLFDKSSYENVLCVGLLLDANGRKMSKHLGNVLEPMALMDQHGADAVRWFMMGSGSAWNDRRVSHEAIDEAVRKVLLTYWHTAAFHTLYARAAGWSPSNGDVPAVAERPALDRWLLSEMAQLTDDVDAAMEGFDVQVATRRIAEVVDDMSNWYVRRSRRRFWLGEPAALATLHESLDVLTRLMAPITPFITERVWEAVIASTDASAPRSVHLANWPEAIAAHRDPQLSDQMRLVRRLVELGRTARAESGVKIRQPLAAGLIAAAGWADLPAELRDEIATEINVASLDQLTLSDELVDYQVRPNFRAIGARFGGQTQQVAGAVRAANPTEVAAALRETGEWFAPLVDGLTSLTGAEIDVTQVPRTGWMVASDDGITVALDLTITPALKRAGIARDVIRLLQQGRKDIGLEVTDRIDVWWQATGEAAQAISDNATTIGEEILAVTFNETTGPQDAPEVRDDDLSVQFWIRRQGL